MKNLLIIEDDANILQLEKDYLEASGYKVSATTDGYEGLEMAMSGDFNLILLDVMLPNVNGFEICQRIRSIKDIPIIFVTAKKEELDKINGLAFGADDYIVKPFSPGELVARVNAHIGRFERLTQNKKHPDDTIEEGNLRLNKSSGTAFVGNVEVNLTKKEFEVLYILASQPNNVFSKNQLFESVWGYDSLGDTSTLTVHINRLREKLKEADPTCEYIRTIWGRGYRLK